MIGRLCICTGCAGHGAHQAVFPSSAVKGQRCPACARAHDRARGSTAARGYGAAHQRERARHLKAWSPGQPCVVCHQPTWDKTKLDLAHNATRTGWLGLAHAECNRGHR